MEVKSDLPAIVAVFFVATLLLKDFDGIRCALRYRRMNVRVLI